MTINIKNTSQDFQNKIILEYKNGKSMRKIQEEYNINRQTLSKFLEEIGAKTTKGNHYRKYYHNEDYFENINTEKKAYWLGFMFADGYITNHDNRYGEDQFGISVAKEDIIILEKFKEDISATNPIHVYDRKNDIGQPLCRIQLTSQKTVNDLIDKGCYKQKSNILLPPKNIPDNLIKHFIRGYFDGDGSIVKSKGNCKYTGNYVYSINITSTEPMVKWIFNYFKMGYITKENRRKYTYYYSLGGHLQVINFYHKLYDDANIWMERKYNRFQELLTKYAER